MVCMNWRVIESICDMLCHSWDRETQDPVYRFCEVCEYSVCTANDETTRYFRCVKEHEYNGKTRRFNSAKDIDGWETDVLPSGRSGANNHFRPQQSIIST